MIGAILDGSSPRLWGVSASWTLTASWQRFIPTPVGSILDSRHQSYLCSVHPHACGEYWTFLAHLERHYGSSPRLWGVYPVCNIQRRFKRFIPTPVGSILNGCWDDIYQPVHPHACGEYEGQAMALLHKVGSSPRLWGVSTSGMIVRTRGRFIPTPVGSILMAQGKRVC